MGPDLASAVSASQRVDARQGRQRRDRPRITVRSIGQDHPPRRYPSPNRKVGPVMMPSPQTPRPPFPINRCRDHRRTVSSRCGWNGDQVKKSKRTKMERHRLCAWPQFTTRTVYSRRLGRALSPPLFVMFPLAPQACFHPPLQPRRLLCCLHTVTRSYPIVLVPSCFFSDGYISVAWRPLAITSAA